MLNKICDGLVLLSKITIKLNIQSIFLFDNKIKHITIYHN